jgi:ankyrin repeat protein
MHSYDKIVGQIRHKLAAEEYHKLKMALYYRDRLIECYDAYPSTCKKINAIIAGDLTTLTKVSASFTDLTAEYHRVEEKRNLSLMGLIALVNNQKVFDFYYRLVEKHFKDHLPQNQDEDAESRTLLHWAVFCRQPLPTIENLIKKKPDHVTTGNDQKATPLHVAVFYPHNTATVKLLLEHGAKVDAKDSNAMTPLHIAAENGNIDSLMLLLLQAAQHSLTTMKNNYDQTLMYLLKSREVPQDTVDMLQELDSFPPHIKKIFYYIKTDNLEKLRGLKIDYATLITTTTITKGTPNATKEIQIPFYAMLSNLRPSQGIFNYLYAIAGPHFNQQVVDADTTTDAGTTDADTTDADTTDADTTTPLHWAVICHQPPLIVRLILAGNIIGKKFNSVNDQDNYKRTPLHYAAANGDNNTVKFLLTRGATMRTTDIQNNSPLDLTAKNNHSCTRQLLTKHWKNSPLNGDNTQLSHPDPLPLPYHALSLKEEDRESWVLVAKSQINLYMDNLKQLIDGGKTHKTCIFGINLGIDMLEKLTVAMKLTQNNYNLKCLTKQEQSAANQGELGRIIRSLGY